MRVPMLIRAAIAGAVPIAMITALGLSTVPSARADTIKPYLGVQGPTSTICLLRSKPSITFVGQVATNPAVVHSGWKIYDETEGGDFKTIDWNQNGVARSYKYQHCLGNNTMLGYYYYAPSHYVHRILYQNFAVTDSGGYTHLYDHTTGWLSGTGPTF